MEQTGKNKKLVIVLDCIHWMELKNRIPLCSDGGDLLKFAIARLSIPRDRWVHTYCFKAQKTQLHRKKADRTKQLERHVEALIAFIGMNQPCVVVGMGRQTVESFTGVSIQKKRIGTNWIPKQQFRNAGIEKVWLTYSIDAALYDPVLIVGITRIIGRAAMEAGIPIKINYDLKMFDWSNYL